MTRSGSSATEGRRGLTVALLGPDGAGKSTLAAALVDALEPDLPVRSVYAGPYPSGRRRATAVPGAGTVLVLGRLGWARARATWHLALGRCVVFDRHPYDALLAPASPRRRTTARRALISRAGVAPDLLLVLDAPAEVLYQRKGEHDVERLEEQRQRYVAFASARREAVLLDTTVGADEILHRALTEIRAARSLGEPL